MLDIATDKIRALTKEARNASGAPKGPIIAAQIAGQQHYNRKTVDMQMGDRLLLVREPENEYDANAVQVLWKNGSEMLGYLPREIADDLAPYMDEGHLITAFCVLPGTGESWTGMIGITGAAVKELVMDAKRAEERLEAEELPDEITNPVPDVSTDDLLAGWS